MQWSYAKSTRKNKNTWQCGYHPSEAHRVDTNMNCTELNIYIRSLPMPVWDVEPAAASLSFRKWDFVFFTREGVNKLWSLCKVSLRQCEANRVAEFAGVCNTKSREVEQSMFSSFTSYTNSHTWMSWLFSTRLFIIFFIPQCFSVLESDWSEVTGLF